MPVFLLQCIQERHANEAIVDGVLDPATTLEKLILLNFTFIVGSIMLKRLADFTIFSSSHKRALPLQGEQGGLSHLSVSFGEYESEIVIAR